MQNFSRRGFQLRTASLETRLAYTGFLLLMLPAVATLLALSVGRVGVAPSAVAAYYRGGASETSFPKALWQLVEVSHFHLFTMPVVVLILAHLLFATPLPAGARCGIAAAMYSGTLLDALGPWAVRYLAGGFAWALLLGWALLTAGALAAVAVALGAMWGPRRWFAEGALPENGGSPK